MGSNSDDSQSADRHSINNGTINSVFMQETNGKVPISTNLVLNRQYHSDTSINEHSQGNNDAFVLEDNINDRVPDFQQDPQEAKRAQGPMPPRKRHRSQPPVTRSHRPPLRSMVSMDGMVYDPQLRRFHRKNVNLDSSGSDPRQLQTGGPRTLPRSYSTDSTGRLPPTSPIGLRSPQSPDSRSAGRTTGSAGGGGSVRDATSLASLDHHLPPTTLQERTKMFRLNLTTILSCIYAVFLVTTGFIIFVFDIFINTAIAELYCLYLVFVGLLYILYLLIDLRIYINKAKTHHKEKRLHEAAYDNMMRQTEDETLNSPLAFAGPSDRGGKQPPFTLELPPPVSPLEHPYCFSQGRHAGSFYLKLGAAVFCLGHLVHSALLLSVQAVYLGSDTNCGNVVILILDILYPFYSFCQLFFIFKYSNVVILRHKEVGRFALMHCIASSICFWIWTIIRETMDSLAMYAKKKDETEDHRSFHEGLWSNVNWSKQPVALPLTSYRMPGALHLRSAFNITPIRDNCSAEVGLDSIFNNLAPHLYPFTIEYSILIVGIFFILWQNIGNCAKEDSANPSSECHDREEWASDGSWENETCKLPTAVEENGLVSNLVIHVDCHSSNKGLFGGILIVVLTLASIIMCFITVRSVEFIEVGVLTIEVTEITLHVLMLITVLLAFSQIKKLDVDQHPVSLLDDLLLFICIPAFFMEVLFTFIPALVYGNFMQFIIVSIICLQVLVQTPFITDALRRCSNSRQLQRVKPGRELITFLVVCNVSTWIFETFTIKNAGIDDLRYDYYGKILWTILGHVTTPLCMFYRFHSSVCLVDIWKGAYQPGNSH